jgi:membrane fusion protein (multidrug efflux system)
MKIRRRIISVLIIVALVVIVTFRLISNKRSFDNQLKMVSELNTTIPVLTDTVKYKQIENGFSTNGTFTPFQEISIASETQGKIISINAETGDDVRKGQVLTSIDNEILASQLALAKYNLEKAEKDLKRFEQLFQGDAATIQQYEAIKQVFVNAQFAYTSAKVQNDNAFIKAPFNGFITKRYIENGTYISPGTPVFDMVEINKVKLIAKLTVAEVAKVRKAQSVKISVDAYPGVTYEGLVSNIVVKADLSNRYEVQIDVNNNSDNLIKPGMYGSVLFANDSKMPVLVIPRRAIANSIMNPEIFLVKGDSVIKQSIIASSLNDKYVVIRSGLMEGDVIVTSGQINLVNGSKIRFNN